MLHRSSIRFALKFAKNLAIIAVLLKCGLAAGSAFAQDTKVVGSGGGGWDTSSQQIPGPACLTTHGAWEGGTTPCAPNEHETWLADIQHWRTERRIRIGYNDARYEMP